METAREVFKELMPRIDRLEEELAALRSDAIPQPVRHAAPSDSTSIDHAVVRDTYDGNQYVVNVERLVSLDAAPFWEWSGVTEDVRVLPGLLSLDYQKLASTYSAAWGPALDIIAIPLMRVSRYWIAVPIAVAEVRQFKVVSVDGDYLIGHRWDGVVESGDNVQIAKPYLLRRTPFDTLTRDGITYTYDSDTARTATNTAEETESQVIVPKYVVGDIIYATHHIDGGTDAYYTEAEASIQLTWLEDNRDGRAWAKASGDE